MEKPAHLHDSIWAPWRVEYFSTDKGGDFLGEAARTSDDAAHLVVARRKGAFLMMNRYPYAVGHLMAVPYRKTGAMEDLTAGEQGDLWDLWDLAIDAQKRLRIVMKAQGFNIGLNLGECAGAGVADHLHLHIVPRWSGDNNFMPVLSGTRVMPEALESLYVRLMEAGS